MSLKKHLNQASFILFIENCEKITLLLKKILLMHKKLIAFFIL
jgi:hypothetical protein